MNPGTSTAPLSPRTQMPTLFGLNQLRLARDILESADRSVRERFLDAANAYWDAMRFYADWPQELPAATDEVHAVILAHPGIELSVAALTDEQIPAAADTLLRFIAQAEAIADGTD